MANAKKELEKFLEGLPPVKYAYIEIDGLIVRGENIVTVLKKLDFEYNDGYGCQNLFGFVWFTDGTWAEREEYDGSEWWEYKRCPAIPAKSEKLTFN
jgi:hypothetical protein